MTGLFDELGKKLEAEHNDTGRPVEDIAEELLNDPDVVEQLKWDAANRLIKRKHTNDKNDWLENDLPRQQLQLPFGEAEFAIDDSKVRYIREDGTEDFKPARYSTGAEREESFRDKAETLRRRARVADKQKEREERQNDLAAQLGLDLRNEIWDKIRHQHTKCWRCGGGWRAGDPFEGGHWDKPESQGGTQETWEHRSCNRSLQDNPTTERLDEDG